MSDSSEDELPEAAPVSTATRKMKPSADAAAIEDTRGMKKNNHGVHKAVMDAVAAAKTSDVFSVALPAFQTHALRPSSQRSLAST